MAADGGDERLKGIEDEARGPAAAAWARVGAEEIAEIAAEAQRVLEEVHLPAITAENFPDLAHRPDFQEELNRVVVANLQAEDVGRLQAISAEYARQQADIRAKHAGGPSWAARISSVLQPSFVDDDDASAESIHEDHEAAALGELIPRLAEQIFETKVFTALNELYEHRKTRNPEQAKILHEIMIGFMGELGVPADRAESMLDAFQRGARSAQDLENATAAGGPRVTDAGALAAPDLAVGGVSEIDCSTERLEEKLGEVLFPHAVARLPAATDDESASDAEGPRDDFHMFMHEQGIRANSIMNARKSIANDREAFAAAHARFEELEANTGANRRKAVTDELTSLRQQMDALNFRMLQQQLAMLESQVTWLRAVQQRAQDMLGVAGSDHAALRKLAAQMEAEMAPMTGTDRDHGQIQILRSQLAGSHADQKAKMEAGIRLEAGLDSVRAQGTGAQEVRRAGFEATFLEQHLNRELVRRQRGGQASDIDLRELHRQDDAITQAMRDRIRDNEAEGGHAQAALDAALKGNATVAHNMQLARAELDVIDKAILAAANGGASQADAFLKYLQTQGAYKELQGALHTLNTSPEDQQAMSVARAILLRASHNKDLGELSEDAFVQTLVRFSTLEHALIEAAQKDATVRVSFAKAMTSEAKYWKDNKPKKQDDDAPSWNLSVEAALEAVREDGNLQLLIDTLQRAVIFGLNPFELPPEAQLRKVIAEYRASDDIKKQQLAAVYSEFIEMLHDADGIGSRKPLLEYMNALNRHHSVRVKVRDGVSAVINAGLDYVASKVRSVGVWLHVVSEMDEEAAAAKEDAEQLKALDPTLLEPAERYFSFKARPKMTFSKIPGLDSETSAKEFEVRRMGALWDALFPPGPEEPASPESQIRARAVAAYLKDHPELSIAIDAILDGKSRETVGQAEMLAVVDMLPPQNDAFFVWRVMDPSKLPDLGGVADVRDALTAFASLQHTTEALLDGYRKAEQDEETEAGLEPDETTTRLMDVAFGTGTSDMRSMCMRMQAYNRQFGATLQMWEAWDNNALNKHMQTLDKARGALDGRTYPQDAQLLDELYDAIEEAQKLVQERKTLLKEYHTLTQYQEQVTYLKGLTKANSEICAKMWPKRNEQITFEAYSQAKNEAAKTTALGALKRKGLVDDADEEAAILGKAKDVDAEVTYLSAQTHFLQDAFRQVTSELVTIDRDGFPATGMMEFAADEVRDFMGFTGDAVGGFGGLDDFGMGKLGKSYLEKMLGLQTPMLSKFGREDVGQLVTAFRMASAKSGAVDLSQAYAALFARLKSTGRDGGIEGLKSMLRNVSSLPAWAREHPEAAREIAQNLGHSLAILNGGDSELGSLSPVLTGLAARSQLPAPVRGPGDLEEEAISPEIFALMHFARVAPLLFNLAKGINEGSTAGNLVRKLGIPLAGPVLGLILDGASSILVTGAQKYVLYKMDDDSDVFVRGILRASQGTSALTVGKEAALTLSQRSLQRAAIAGRMEVINPVNYVRFARSEAGEKVNHVGKKTTARILTELGLPATAATFSGIAVKAALVALLGSTGVGTIILLVGLTTLGVVGGGLSALALVHTANNLLFFRGMNNAYQTWLQHRKWQAAAMPPKKWHDELTSDRVKLLFPER